MGSANWKNKAASNALSDSREAASYVQIQARGSRERKTQRSSKEHDDNDFARIRKIFSHISAVAGHGVQGDVVCFHGSASNSSRFT